MRRCCGDHGAAVIRVLVADDHPLVRQGIVDLLAPSGDLVVVAVAENGEQAAEQALVHQPDVVLMDLSMPTLDGVAATGRVLAVSPASAVVILTSFSEAARVRSALAAGAVGYLLKDCEPAELLGGVRAAAAGDSPFSPRAARALLPSRDGRQAGRPSLSPREVEVLQAVARGLPNKSVARQLRISEKTVKAHLTRIFAVLGVPDRTSAALWAQRNGLVDP